MVPHITANPSNFRTTGSITENGDSNWDSSELDIYNVNIFRGETIDISFSGEGKIEVMLCNCKDYHDIEQILSDLYYTSNSMKLYMWIDSYSVTSGSYKASSDKSLGLAVFSYNSFNPSKMDYTITHSIPFSSRYDYEGTMEGNDDGSLNDGEYVEFYYEINSEIFDFRILPSRDVGVLICDCGTLAMAQDAIDTGNPGEGGFLFTTSSYEGINERISSRVNYHIYVYSLDAYPAYFTIITNIPQGDRINDRTFSEGSIGKWIIYLGLLTLLGFIAYKIYQNQKKNSHNPPPYTRSSYTSNVFMDPKVSQPSPPPAQDILMFCPDCGAKVTTKFCTGCGNKLR